jgi:hypothetical protein
MKTIAELLLSLGIAIVDAFRKSPADRRMDKAGAVENELSDEIKAKLKAREGKPS